MVKPSPVGLTESEISFKGPSSLLLLTDQPIKKYDFSQGTMLRVRDTLTGEIEFLEGVNERGDDLSGNVRVVTDIILQNNLALVRSGERTGLNKPAIIKFFNLNNNFASPVILRNGERCPDAVCTANTPLNQNNVEFEVSEWSSYSIGEDLTEPLQQTENIDEEIGCATDWVCTPWTQCNQDGTQTRTCIKRLDYCYINQNTKPIETQPCNPRQQPLAGELPQNQQETNSLFSIITGAVVGLLGKTPVAAVLVFLLLFAAVYIIVAFRKGRR